MQRTQVDYSYQKKQQNKLCISDTDVRVRTPADKWEVTKRFEPASLWLMLFASLQQASISFGGQGLCHL